MKFNEYKKEDLFGTSANAERLNNLIYTPGQTNQTQGFQTGASKRDQIWNEKRQ